MYERITKANRTCF